MSDRDSAYSRLSVKSQTVIPRTIREALGVGPGDVLRYRMTADGILIDKAAAPADDLFASFSEWAEQADEKAYGAL